MVKVAEERPHDNDSFINRLRQVPRQQRLTAFIIVASVIILPLTVFNLVNRQPDPLRSQADALSTPFPSPAVRGVPGDVWADVVLGKNDFNQGVPNQVVAWKLLNPGGTVVDRNVRPNRLYVYDGANSRVLGHASIGSCYGDETKSCTADSDCVSSSEDTNISSQAQINCSSEFVTGWCQFVKDNFRGVCNTGEWATATQPTGWVKFNFSNTHTINKILLYDRACPEQVLSGHIIFSDGSRVDFGALEDTGTSATEVTFSARSVTWIEVWIDISRGSNVGFSEIEIIGHSDEPISLCTLKEGKPADLVLGQPQPQNYSGCNNDGNMELYPYRKPASAATLCSNEEKTVSPYESGTFAGMAVDKNSNLYVPDLQNNRVLKYIDPFNTDVIADDVWGQKDFFGNRCNFTDDDLRQPGLPLPTSDSLCLAGGATVAGVDLDTEGNLWVADASNHRVLRFSKQVDGTITKTADLVLGQKTFTTPTAGSDTWQMNEPATVQVDPVTSWVYVADKKNHRVSVFKPPFTSGMAYTALVGSGYLYPEGLLLDPNGEGLWVSDNGNHMLELWDLNQTSIQPKKILFKDTYQPNGKCGSTLSNLVCTNPVRGTCLDKMCDVRGSVGVDSDGNLLIASSNINQDVYRYKAPIPIPESGKSHGATHQLFYPPSGRNLYSKFSLSRPQDVLISHNQLIISDDMRILFWNNPENLVNGQPPDGAAGVSVFEEVKKNYFGYLGVDANNHLITSSGSSIVYFDLPLSHGEMPVGTLLKPGVPIPVLGGGEVNWIYTDNISGLDYDAQGDYLWFSHATSQMSRVYRVRNLFTTPMVDVILGQANTSDYSCNRDPTTNPATPQGAAPNTVCRPGAVKVDRVGNVWVSDHSLETEGNRRILMFKADKFQSIIGNVLFGPDADVVSGTTQTWKMGFDSQNRMAVGHNGISGEENRFFVSLYANPSETLKSSVQDDVTLRDLFSHAFSTYFDGNDDLYVVDLNRGRMLKFLKPFDVILPSPSPSPQPTPSPSPTPIPSASPETVTLTATEDTFITSSSPTTTKGNEVYMRINSSSDRRALVRFNAALIPPGATIAAATLRLYNIEGSAVAGAISRVNGSWSESTTYYNNAPPVGTKIADFPNPATINTWKELSVLGAVVGGGNVDFYITTTSSDGADYLSSEGGVEKPTLVVTYLTGPAPSPSPQPSPGVSPSPSSSPNSTPTPAPGSTFFVSVAADDGHVVESGETTNVGGSVSTTSSIFRVGDSSSDKQFKGILSFDTSSLPDTATITSVKVKMRRNSVSGTDPFTTHGDLVLDIKNGSFGAVSLEKSDFEAVATLTNVATFTKPTVNGQWAEALLPSNAFSVVNPTGKTQVRVYFTTDDNDDLGNDYLSFTSGNNSTSSYRPVLEVVYQ